MKLFLAAIAILLSTLAAPALAQGEGGEAAMAVITPQEQERLDLAARMHEIWPVRTRIEVALDAIAANFPAERDAEVKAALRRAIQFDQLEEESIKAMAEIFTAEELRAMIEFYGSEIGRSVSAKTGDYELVLRPVMVRMIDRAMLDLRIGTQP